LSSSSSENDSLKVGLETGVEPGSSSIWWSIARFGGRPEGKVVGNTSWYLEMMSLVSLVVSVDTVEGIFSSRLETCTRKSWSWGPSCLMPLFICKAEIIWILGGLGFGIVGRQLIRPVPKLVILTVLFLQLIVGFHFASQGRPKIMS
jgi:hypothetical protein